MIEAGKAYVSYLRLFVSVVRDLSHQFQCDYVISVRHLYGVVGEGRKPPKGCLDHEHWVVCALLQYI